MRCGLGGSVGVWEMVVVVGGTGGVCRGRQDWDCVGAMSAPPFS